MTSHSQDGAHTSFHLEMCCHLVYAQAASASS